MAIVLAETVTATATKETDLVQAEEVDLVTEVDIKKVDEAIMMIMGVDSIGNIGTKKIDQILKDEVKEERVEVDLTLTEVNAETETRAVTMKAGKTENKVYKFCLV